MTAHRSKINAPPRHFVQAQPGFWLLEPCGIPETGEYLADRTPIVAWEMRLIDDAEPERGCFAIPVTADWSAGHTEREPILGPDGLVRIAGEATYDTEAEWLKDASAKARAKIGAAR